MQRHICQFHVSLCSVFMPPCIKKLIKFYRSPKKASTKNDLYKVLIPALGIPIFLAIRSLTIHWKMERVQSSGRRINVSLCSVLYRKVRKGVSLVEVDPFVSKTHVQQGINRVCFRGNTKLELRGSFHLGLFKFSTRHMHQKVRIIFVICQLSMFFLCFFFLFFCFVQRLSNALYRRHN